MASTPFAGTVAGAPAATVTPAAPNFIDRSERVTGTSTSRGSSAALDTVPANSAPLAAASAEAEEYPNDATALQETSCNSISEPISVLSGA